MTDGEDRWDRLAELFELAGGLDPAARQALLRDLAASDADLAERLEAMLAADAGRLGVLDRRSGVVAGLIGDVTGAAPPSHVGRYRIVRLLGEGGMGRVYLVEREAVGGHAALKILRDAWVSDERRQRFLAEQRTLAQLSHPDIAQLHDAGTLPDGTPWFAMEYVEGTPITEYAAARRLSVAQRLALIGQVCRAVQHAHAHAVIHRDLKPSNVLVTPSGDVKLLDFGIAKQLDAIDADERTRTGYRMLTPAYAAPEQFTGGPIGTWTDVHPIGVMLYLLLTGQLPWPPQGETSGDPLLGRSREVTRPSLLAERAGAAPGRASWRELDVLVQTAMHQDPARRYQGVGALARDIEHYLANEPLEARPDSWRYRTARFLRRRWREVAVAAVVAIAVVGLSAGYAVSLRRARDAARGEAARTARIQEFMLGLFQGDDPDAGPADSLRVVALIDRGEREAAALDGEPMVQAELRETLGELRRQLGELPQSDSLLALALASRDRSSEATAADRARVRLALARLRIDQARFPEADTLAREALMLARPALGVGHPVVREGLATLARVAEEESRLDEAIALEDTVLALLRPDTTSLEYASAMVALASSHFYAGHLDVSDSLNRAALAIYRARRGDEHPLVAEALINLGAAEFERGHYTSAEDYDRQALRRTEAWYGHDHPTTASTLTLIGRALVRQEKFEPADSILNEAVRILERVHGPVHPRVASALNELGTNALVQGRLADAERYYTRNLAIYDSLYGGHHWLIGIAESNLASTWMAAKRYRDAEGLYRKAIAEFTDGQGPEHLNTAIGWIKLGRSLLRQERYREAVEASRKGYDLLMARSDPPATFVKAARTDLAAEYEQLGDKAQAVKFKDPE